MPDLLSAIRAEVMAQPEAARVDYALDLLRFYLDPVPDFLQGCARLGLCLSARDCRVLHALDCRRGQFVSLDALQAAAMADVAADEWGNPEAIYLRLSHIRRRLAKARIPAAITAWRGVGFRLDAPASWSFVSGIHGAAAQVQQ